MASEIPLRPARKTSDPVIARFTGWVVRNNGTAKGYHEFTIAVDKTEKYHGMRMTDFPGLMTFEVRQAEQVELAEGLDDELSRALFGDDSGGF